MRILILICLLGPFGSILATPPDNSCENAGALIGFVEDHIRSAIAADELKISRYHAYKALNTIEKSRKKFEACSCDYARKQILESLENLKLATRVASLDGTRILLKRALNDALSSEESIEQHETEHNKRYDNDVLALNTADAVKISFETEEVRSKTLENRIDQSLMAYRNSLEEVVGSVPCDEALVFVRRIYEHCERQLLREDLTPAKRYYNSRTKEITEDALDRLRGCSQ